MFKVHDLKRLRYWLKVTQRELAKMLGLSDNGYRDIQRWEGGEVQPRGAVQRLFEQMAQPFETSKKLPEYVQEGDVLVALRYPRFVAKTKGGKIDVLYWIDPVLEERQEEALELARRR